MPLIIIFVLVLLISVLQYMNELDMDQDNYEI